MSKNVAIFIDVANLYYAARGQDVDVDYVALLKYATKGRDLIRAYAYSGLDPENENQRKFLDFLSKNGYKVVHKDIRKFGDGRVKANLDIELVVDLFRLRDRMDIAVIISGDGDFAPAIRALQDEGVRCEVISFRPNTSSDLGAVADEFIDIMKILGIGRKKGEKAVGVSMPEMPAKEVNPEFGFREASRGVAAAAMAALREGEVAAPRTRRGRTSRKAPAEAAVAEAVPAEAAAAEPVEPMSALEAHAVVKAESGDAEGRRRRRRRGGRGRGRGRREGQPAVAELPDAGAEIGWQEFDDLSQLGDLTDTGSGLTDFGEPGQERDFAFSEADAATLAELGLASPGATDVAEEPMVAEGDSAQAAPASAAGRRRGPAARGRRQTARRPRTGAAAETTSAEAADSAVIEGPSDAPAPRRRRRAATGAAAPAASGEAGSEAQPTTATPRPRTTRRRTSASPAAARTKPTETAVEATTSTEAPAPRPRRRRARSEGEAPSRDTANTSEPGSTAGEEGIWQRFRSGRGTRSSRQ